MDRLGTVLGQQIAPVDTSPVLACDCRPRRVRGHSGWLHTVRAGDFTFHRLTGQGREPSADAAARFPSGRFAHRTANVHSRERSVRYQDAAGPDRTRQAASQSNFFCRDRIGRITHLTGSTLAKPGQYQIAGRALHRRPRGRRSPMWWAARVPFIIEGYSGLACADPGAHPHRAGDRIGASSAHSPGCRR